MRRAVRLGIVVGSFTAALLQGQAVSWEKAVSASGINCMTSWASILDHNMIYLSQEQSLSSTGCCAILRADSGAVPMMETSY